MQQISPVQEKKVAPSFSTIDSEGNPVCSNSLLGTKYLLYFYPRDNTPGCTAQACGFRENYDFFVKKNILLFGISGDSIKSHQKFRGKYNLPFALLMDEDHSIAKAFGVWGEKKFMGRKFEGIHRISFLIDENGVVTKVYIKVKAKTHPQELTLEL